MPLNPEKSRSNLVIDFLFCFLCSPWGISLTSGTSAEGNPINTNCAMHEYLPQIDEKNSASVLQLYLSDVAFIFPDVISMAFCNSYPRNATACKSGETKTPLRLRPSAYFFLKTNLLPSLWSPYFIYCISAHLHKAFLLWANNCHCQAYISWRNFSLILFECAKLFLLLLGWCQLTQLIF